jgi:hypothetical protein
MLEEWNQSMKSASWSVVRGMDDARLMDRSVDKQSELELEVHRVTTEDGYFGPRDEAASEKRNVPVRVTRVPGGRSPPAISARGSTIPRA